MKGRDELLFVVGPADGGVIRWVGEHGRVGRVKWLVGDRMSKTRKSDFSLLRAGGVGTGSVQGSQPGDPCGVGAACPATGVDHKYDTRRLLLAGKSLAPHASPGPLHRPPHHPIAHPPGFAVPLPPPSPPGSPRDWRFKSPAPDSLPPSRDCAGTRGGESGSWVAAPGSRPFSRDSWAPRAGQVERGWAA